MGANQSVQWGATAFAALVVWAGPAAPCDEEYAKLTVTKRRYDAVVEHEGANPEKAARATALLNDPSAMESEVNARPVSKSETSRIGLRSLEATLDWLPGQLVKFSGIGVVRETGPNELTLSPPELGTGVDQKAHLSEMATTFVASDGTYWVVKNHSAFGTYDKADLGRKVQNTQRWGSNDVQLIAAGGFKKGARDVAAGWMIYSIPKDAASPLSIYESNPQQYQGTLKLLGARLKKNHDEGVAHMQIHPGNWFVTEQGGQPRILITDWSTAQDVNNLLSPSELKAKGGENGRDERYYGEVNRDLTPAQRALAHDFRVITARSLAPEPETGVFGIARAWSDKEVAYRLRGLVNLMDGYQGWDLKPAETEKMVAKLLEAYKPLTMDLLEFRGGAMDLDDYSGIAVAHFGAMGQRLALTEMADRMVREVLTKGGDHVRASLNGEVEFAHRKMSEVHPPPRSD